MKEHHGWTFNKPFLSGRDDSVSERAHDKDSHEEKVRDMLSGMKIEDFFDWPIAAPLYYEGYNRGYPSGVFEEEWVRMIDERDTYMDTVDFGFTVDPLDTKEEHPVLRLAVIVPLRPNKEKLARTAELVERLFTPMAAVYPDLPVELYCEPIPGIDLSGGDELSVMRNMEGNGFAVYCLPDRAYNYDMSGSMLECLQYASRTFLSRVAGASK